ncbi:unnamed protein product [Paramecium sonneborni]|uniref:Uncharacterized protein n=1 Tax=Paramecium sonneborni TaxID=65129 RepID=A0A8S1QF90_9CILI|nr:unnamed protein product [Paramecium sonneborni]
MMQQLNCMTFRVFYNLFRISIHNTNSHSIFFTFPINSYNLSFFCLKQLVKQLTGLREPPQEISPGAKTSEPLKICLIAPASTYYLINRSGNL